MSQFGMLKTPENELIVAAVRFTVELKDLKDDSGPSLIKKREELEAALFAAAIAYSRYFVAEECAKIADTYDKQSAAAIREHGGQHPSHLDLSGCVAIEGGES